MQENERRAMTNLGPMQVATLYVYKTHLAVFVPVAGRISRSTVDTFCRASPWDMSHRVDTSDSPARDHRSRVRYRLVPGSPGRTLLFQSPEGSRRGTPGERPHQECRGSCTACRSAARP